MNYDVAEIQQREYDDLCRKCRVVELEQCIGCGNFAWCPKCGCGYCEVAPAPDEDQEEEEKA